ncbi:hypothetical protein ANTQUA_LOCUS955 [Anthophora quadrimaculata]
MSHIANVTMISNLIMHVLCSFYRKSTTVVNPCILKRVQCPSSCLCPNRNFSNDSNGKMERLQLVERNYSR